MKASLWIVLTTLAIRAEASSRDWSNLVRSLNALEYRVKSGDTLSKITQNYLGDKNYWPKLWEINQKTVSNPHLLEPEQILLFDSPSMNEKRTLSSSSQETPSKPKTKEKISEDIPDKLLRPVFKHQHRLRFVVLPPEEILGVVTGAFENRSFLTVNDLVYIGAFEKNKVLIGQKYALVRELSEKEKTTAKMNIQGIMLRRVVGELQIESYGDDLALGRILSAQELIERGDKLAQVPPLSLQDPESPAPPDFKSRILLGERLQDTLIHTGQLVLLEGGNKNGIQLGNVFSVFDDEDPVFKSHDLIEPRSKGEIKVVWLAENVSVGYVMKVRALVHVGDSLISAKHFPSSASKVQLYRQKTNIE